MREISGDSPEDLPLAENIKQVCGDIKHQPRVQEAG